MRFFAGVPLVMKDGRAVGVLSVLHSAPLGLSDAQKDALVALARQMVDGLELTRYHYETEEGAPVPLSRAATRDPLTGLQNRAALHESMMRSIAHANRYAEKMAFLYVDIDNLRKVNETCGRGAGDSLLVEAGKRLQAAVRGADTVARLGGDEFAVLAQGLSGAEDAVLVAQKLHRALSLPYDTQGLRFTPSCSIGVSIFPHDGVDGDSLLRHADTAMYRAKSGGRGGYELFASNVR
jgi:diguanylate cyclase (GGDEF)-like protein